MAVNPYWPAVLVGAGVLALVGYQLWRARQLSWPLGRRLLIGLLVVLAALRPGFGVVSDPGRTTNLDVVIMLDRSLSMMAEDYNGSDPRLLGAKADIRRVPERFPGARFAVVTFDHVGRLELPLTTDTTAVMTLVEVAGPREYYNQGTSIDVGLPAAEAALSSSAQRSPNRKRLLVYLGDGEQTVEKPVDSFATLKTYLSGALVLGYGTTQGGRMRNGSSYVTDGHGGKALSTIDENNLRQIADQLGGSYQHRTAPSEVQIAAPDVRGTGSSAMVSSGDDWSWLVGLLLLGPVLWELWDAARGRQFAARVRGASRKGSR